ncbi:MAG TPA: L,D-transpeptidase family protein [Steroidobacteraceae bacterium]|nr:L,D-transpeptidase family protein [Steroidobacteraceae bacterium]
MGLLIALAGNAQATQYPLTSVDALMFGEIETITAFGEDTLPDLARRYSLGYEEIQRANPGVDLWLPGEGTTIVIPGQRLLPSGPHEGIVVNLPEHRLYYYPKVKKGETPYVITYPVSIGKMDWSTPLGKTRIVDKRKNPTWSPPESVRKEHAERGDPLPRVVKAGPDNPLGAYAMRLDIHPGAYLIHGTNNPIAVGMAITHGCIRMYPEDIEALYPKVPVNTPVWLINEPVKLARVNGQVWLEVHPPVDAEGQSAEVDLEGFYALVNAALGDQPAAIHWDFVVQTLKEASGIPQMIGLEVDAEDVPSSLTEPTPVEASQPATESQPSAESQPAGESPPPPAEQAPAPG